MLEHYSHVRIDATRKALDALDVMRSQDRLAKTDDVEYRTIDDEPSHSVLSAE